MSNTPLTPDNCGASQIACNIVNNTFLSLDGFEPMRKQMAGTDYTAEHFGAELARIVDREIADIESNSCSYCGGSCPSDEDNACDGYIGDIDGLDTFIGKNYSIELIDDQFVLVHPVGENQTFDSFEELVESHPICEESRSFFFA